MPFDSEQFLKIKQFDDLTEHLNFQRILFDVEKEALDTGKDLPPRGPADRPLTSNAFIRELAELYGVVIIGGP